MVLLLTVAISSYVGQYCVALCFSKLYPKHCFCSNGFFFRKNQAVAFDLFRLVTVCSSGKMYVFFFHKLEWKSD